MKKEEKIALIRNSIKSNKYPLKYNFLDVYKKGNCYSYAIGSSYEDEHFLFSGEEYIYNLGCISNSPPATTIEEAEKNFIKDMEKLGILVRKSSLNEPILKDEWKVVLFYEDAFIDSYDFHFARQDEDGNWSHKEFINGPIRILGSNPENCTDLTLVSYYVLKVDKTN